MKVPSPLFLPLSPPVDFSFVALSPNTWFGTHAVLTGLCVRAEPSVQYRTVAVITVSSLVLAECPLLLGVFHDLLLHVEAFAPADGVHVFQSLVGRIRLLTKVKIFFFSCGNPVRITANDLGQEEGRGERRTTSEGQWVQTHPQKNQNQNQNQHSIREPANRTLNKRTVYWSVINHHWNHTPIHTHIYIYYIYIY